MKKQILFATVVLCTLVAIPASAQRYYGQQPVPRYGRSYIMPNTYYGFRLGVMASKVTSDDRYLDGSDTKAGLNVGAVVGVQLTPRAPLYFETGLSYSEKGGKGNFEGNKFTYNLNYIELPLVLKYNFYVDRDISVQPFAGGYLACGVGGKIKDFGNREAFNSFNDHNFKRFDGGIRIGCGAQFNLLYLELGYDFGLANVCDDNFETSRNGAFFANIGVNF